MHMYNKISIKGKLTIRNRETGEILYEKENLITDDGLSLLADRLESNGANFLTHFAIGDDVTIVAVTDTALGNELFRKAFLSTSSVSNVFSAQCEVDISEAQFIWKEFGTLNAASGGVLFNHLNIDYDHPTQAVNVLIQYDVTITRG